MHDIDMKLLTAPFLSQDLDWLVIMSGFSKQGSPYVMVAPYINSRAIMDRLDTVCGADRWQVTYRPGMADNGIIASISIKVHDGEWITKEDGAGHESNNGGNSIDATKSACTSAIRRAAVPWGIGRYLYDLPRFFAVIGHEGESICVKDKRGGNPDQWVKWLPPQLPENALSDEEKSTRNSQRYETTYDTSNTQEPPHVAVAASANQINTIFKLLTEMYNLKAHYIKPLLGEITGREIGKSTDLTATEAESIIEKLGSGNRDITDLIDAIIR